MVRVVRIIDERQADRLDREPYSYFQSQIFNQNSQPKSKTRRGRVIVLFRHIFK